MENIKIIVNKNDTLSYKFYSLFLEIIKNLDDKFKKIEPASFLFTFISKHKIYAGNLQHDIQEFCRIFLEDFNIELNRVSIKSIYKENKYK